jgi:hypothetical protein
MISKEDYAAGDVPSAVNYNNAAKNANDAGGFRDNINAAETISALRPVFLDDTSNTWKYSDANDTARLKFSGFSLEAGSVGNPMKVQLSGIVRGLSSLDAGKDYYVQDDGTIGTTRGTYNIVVGTALTATELLIKKVKRIVVIEGGRAAAALSGSVNYSHNLGVVPRLIKIHSSGNSNALKSEGVWADGFQRASFWGDNNGAPYLVGKIVYVYATNNGNTVGAITSVTATQITIAWVTTPSGGQDISFWAELYE